MVLRRSVLVATLAILLALLGLGTVLRSANADPDPPSYSKTNRDPTFIQVYDANVENLETAGSPGPDKCKGDWQDLVSYMKLQGLSPDLFTVQQLSGRAQLDQLLAYMNKTLKGQYKGVVAKASPAQGEFKTDCPRKKHQTNAVIYRVGRFGYTPGSATTWGSISNHRRGGHGHGGACHADGLDRSVNIALPLYDKVSTQHIVAGSFHWPTGKRGGDACLNNNASKTAQYMGRVVKRLGSTPVSLRLMGGDANATETAGSDRGHWLRALNGQRGGKYGYAEAAYSACGGQSSCLAKNWTIGQSAHKRIDYLFARAIGGHSFPGVTGFSTVSWESGDRADLRLTGKDDRKQNYSDHRALKARISYPR